MKSLTAETKADPAAAKDPVPDLEQECRTWDWARAAGVSDHELRKALRDTLHRPQDR